MYVSLSATSIHACNDLGAFFYIQEPGHKLSQNLLPVKPQVSFTNYGIIRDTQNWVWLRQKFVADSAYEFMVIGGFHDYDTLKSDTVKRQGGRLPSAYYIIDSVVVVAVDSLLEPPEDTPVYKDTLTFNLNHANPALCAGDSLRVTYGIHGNLFFNGGNVFTLQLSADTSQFRNPVTLGSVASYSRGTIKVRIPPNFPEGYYRVRITSSDPGRTFTGSVIRISRKPEIKTGKKIELCVGEDIQLTARASYSSSISWAGPASFYATRADTTIKQARPNNAGAYIATANNTGCIVMDTVQVAIGCQAIAVPSAFSPNGDGKNDILYAFSTGDVALLRFSIYNRWGQIVFETSDITKGWDGRINGNELEMDTYAYIVKATFRDNTRHESRGNVTLIR